ncbi:unnamed protein product [Soboliphyme baturini]|uniref:Cadherin domain-containing protein n=1 Tax=Soboliphyme baturini TaxID=241478 RepID=A0A183I9S4_9BILA|nr:unnamed protein product [Soboliphyme baturini]
MFQATDKGEPAMTSFAMVHIDIVDVNDNPPRFTQQPSVVNVTLTEGEEPQDPLLVRGLVDINGTVWASFGNFTSIAGSYVVTVTAYDLGRPSLSSSLNITVFVTSVDCSQPSLLRDSYLKEVDSALPINSTVIMFPQELSCPQNFAITGRDDDYLFGIDSTIGRIYINRQIRPQELNKTLNLSVTAFSTHADKEFKTFVRTMMHKLTYLV